MSRYASAAFIEANDDHQLSRKRITLVQITLTDPSSRTLRLSDYDVTTPDGNVWEGLLGSVGPIECKSELLSEGPDHSICPIRIKAQKVGFQTDNTHTILKLLQEYEWQGAAVVVSSWIEGLPSAADANPEFVGTIESYESDATGISLSVKQGTAWAASFPDVYANSTTTPGAPEGTMGRVLPALFGDRRAEGLRFRSPFQGGYDDMFTAKEQMGGGSLVDPGVVVDTGRGTGRLIVAFSGHPIAQFAQRYGGANLFMRGGDFLAELDWNGLVLENDAKGARFSVAFQNIVARTGVIPPDIQHTRENPASALAAIDIFATDIKAELNNNSPNRQLELVIPNATPLGMKQLPAYFCIAYSTASNSSPLRVYPRVPSNLIEGPKGTLPVTAGLEFVGFRLVEYWQGSAAAEDDWYSINADVWNFGGGVNNSHPFIDLIVDFALASANNSAYVYWAGIIVAYAPQRQILNPGYSPGRRGGYDVGGRRRTGQPRPGEVFYGGQQIAPIGSVQEIVSDFFHNWAGWKDSVADTGIASGTFTGTSDAVISRACDLANFILQHYGKVAAAGIELGTNVFGSFVDARTGHLTLEGHSVTAARAVTQVERVSDAISSLARETVANAFITRRNGKWAWVPWDIEAVVNYDKVLEADDLCGPFISVRQTESNIVNRIRTLYGWDAFRGANLHSAFIGPSASSAGFAASGRRDQALTVVASQSDRLDFNVSGVGTVAASLTPGDYTGVTGMQHVRTQMKAVGGATDILVQYGFEVVAGENDLIPIDVAGSDFTVTIPAGSYPTGASLAAAITTAANAAGTGRVWTVTYSTACIFTVSCTGGSATLEWTRGGAVAGKLASLLIGFDANANTTINPSASGVIACFGETFRVARASGTMTLFPRTGTNKARSAWPMLGWDPLYDRPAVLETQTRIFTAFVRAGIRERNALKSSLTHGGRPELTLDTQWVNTSEGATNLRDRVFDWRCEQPSRIKFPTLRMPDIDRMMVFTTGASLDRVRPYSKVDPSASWAGRKWLALEVRRDLGEKSLTEVVAVEVKKSARDTTGVEPGAGFTPPGTPAGLAFVLAFIDQRDLTNKLYMQAVDTLGANIPPITGTQLATSESRSISSNDIIHAIPDAQGFYYIAWSDGSRTHVQKFDSLGGKLWGSDGVIVGTSTTLTRAPRLCLDGAGGVCVVWEDNGDLLAQRVLYTGQVAWTAGGVDVCSTTGDALRPTIVTDGAGGCIIAWDDSRGANVNIYAQRISGSGVALWTTDGISVCAATGNQVNARGCVDGGGGMIVAWEDQRLGGGLQQIFAARIKADGTLPWTADGVNVKSSSTFDNGGHGICEDGAGGACVAWYRSGSNAYNQRFDNAGTRLWNSLGHVLAHTGNVLTDPPIAVCPDGSGGMITGAPSLTGLSMLIEGTDSSGAQDFSATVRSSGLSGTVSNASVARTAAGKYIIAWEDRRGGGSPGQDLTQLYAQEIDTAEVVSWTTGGVLVASQVHKQGWPVVLIPGTAPSQTSAITVDNSNKYIDMHDTADRNTTIALGTYAADRLAEEMQKGMNGGSLDGPLAASGHYQRAGYGTLVRAGHNDKLAVNPNITGSYEGARTSTIAAGDYQPEDLCTIVNAALAATWSDKPITWTLLYDSATGKFELRCTSLYQPGARTGDSIWATLGGTADQSEGPAPAVSGYWTLAFTGTRHYHRYWLKSSYATNVWEWSTGTNSASSIGRTAGFSVAADSGAVGDVEAESRVG